MKVELKDSNINDKQLIKNMFVFYRYDLLPFQFDESDINECGIIADENVKTHEEGVNDCDIFWEKPDSVFPLLIVVDDIPTGFAVVTTKPYAHPKVNYRLNDFFILNKYRNNGVGERAVSLLFDKMPGIWELGWLEKNIAAEKFWYKVVKAKANTYQNWEYFEGKDANGEDNFIPGLYFEIN